MNQPLKKPPLRALVLISSPKLAEKAGALFAQNRLAIHYQLRGQGTASSEMMDVLGLGNVAKSITLALMPAPAAAEMLARLETDLKLRGPNTGVAFTTAVDGVSVSAMRLMDETLRKEWQTGMEQEAKKVTNESEYRMIVAVVNQGFSEAVMDAARRVGAKGGTVVHSRQTGGEEAMRLMGITFQEEKEMVLILTKAEDKLSLMRAISESCGMHSEARGVVFSCPLDAVAGFTQG